MSLFLGEVPLYELSAYITTYLKQWITHLFLHQYISKDFLQTIKMTNHKFSDSKPVWCTCLTPTCISILLPLFCCPWLNFERYKKCQDSVLKSYFVLWRIQGPSVSYLILCRYSLYDTVVITWVTYLKGAKL